MMGIILNLKDRKM